MKFLSGDLDHDGDVDLADYKFFSNCLSGPGVTPPGGCDRADLDFSGDVDVADYAAFQAACTG